MGVLVVTYTAFGGNKAVTWADVQQMLLISCALVLALFMAVHLLPANISWAKRAFAGGSGGKAERGESALRLGRPLQPVERCHRRNVPGAGLLRLRPEPGAAVSHGQVDRAKPPESDSSTPWRKSRCSSFILFIGAMVFVLFIFEKPPLLFQPVELKRVQARCPLIPRWSSAMTRRSTSASKQPQRLSGSRAGRDPAAQATVEPRAVRCRAAGAERRARGGRAAGGQGFPRHQLYLPLLRDDVPAGGRGGVDCRGDFYGRDVIDFGRDQFAGRRDGDRSVSEAH